MSTPLLEVRDLSLSYRTANGVVQVLDRIGFDLDTAEAVAVLGESGCGKSSLIRALLQVFPRNLSSISGEINFDGQNLLAFDEERLRAEVRWSRIGYVPQATNALNPVLRIRDQMLTPMRVHQGLGRTAALDRAADVLALVQLSRSVLDAYPGELSGGMRQRVLIAMALCGEPELLVLDEPTSALDVLTQASVIEMLKAIKACGTSLLMVTHDIGAAVTLAERVAVMYAGQIVELLDAPTLCGVPGQHRHHHPYTSGLLESAPRRRRGGARPRAIPGRPPDLAIVPAGCRFQPRCALQRPSCSQAPPVVARGERSLTRCWLNAPEA